MSDFEDVVNAAGVTTNAGRAFVWGNAVKGHEASLAAEIAAIELEAKEAIAPFRAVAAAAQKHVGRFSGQDFERDHEELRAALQLLNLPPANR